MKDFRALMNICLHDADFHQKLIKLVLRVTQDNWRKACEHADRTVKVGCVTLRNVHAFFSWPLYLHFHRAPCPLYYFGFLTCICLTFGAIEVTIPSSASQISL